MRLRWAGPAAHDFVSICDYTEQQYGVAVAGETARRILESVNSLQQSPNLGRPGRKRSTRELVLSDSPILAVYRIRENVIENVRILHGAQRWP